MSYASTLVTEMDAEQDLLYIKNTAPENFKRSVEKTRRIASSILYRLYCSWILS